MLIKKLKFNVLAFIQIIVFQFITNKTEKRNSSMFNLINTQSINYTKQRH